MTNKTENEVYFEFLNDMRASGRFNMFQGPQLLTQMYGMNTKKAREVWVLWTKTFERIEA